MLLGEADTVHKTITQQTLTAFWKMIDPFSLHSEQLDVSGSDIAVFHVLGSIGIAASVVLLTG